MGGGAPLAPPGYGPDLKVSLNDNYRARPYYVFKFFFLGFYVYVEGALIDPNGS